MTSEEYRGIIFSIRETYGASDAVKVITTDKVYYTKAENLIAGTFYIHASSTKKEYVPVSQIIRIEV